MLELIEPDRGGSVPRTLSDILRRFRPAATPGPAAPAGVPVDRVHEAAAELAPVFAALQPSVVAAADALTAARAEAERRERAATEEAERIVADAQARVPAVQAEAAADEVAALDEQCAALERDAREEASRVHAVATAHRPPLVASLVARVWTAAGLEPAAAADPPVARDRS
jgi:hypothetical protein